MIEGDPRHAELLAQRLRKLGLAYDSQLDEHLSELLAVLLLSGERRLELSTRDELGFDEELADSKSGHELMLRVHRGAREISVTSSLRPQLPG